MFQKAELQREIKVALGAAKSTDLLLNAKREHGLQFLIDARRDQTLADVAKVFHGFSDRFEVEPLFPSPPFQAMAPGQEPAWGDTLFLATVYNVAFDDVTARPWDMAHALRAEGNFVRVIPEVPIARPQATAEAELSPSSGSKGWEHQAMRVPEAWAEFGRVRMLPGLGVLIGHPDTGWVPHEVWQTSNFRDDLGRSFMPNEGNSRGKDPLDGPFPGHGTSTASVMVAPRGGSSLEGVAPHAAVIPIRCVSSVLLYPGQPNVMQAVRYAMEQGCRVISLSLGGSAFPFLGPQIVHAAHANILVVAASGNSTFFTAEPANYREVIGVGGTKPGDLEWEESSWFPEGTVDISAPATPVRKADYRSFGGYNTSEGTSYSTAFMAGVAALWLSRHFPNGYRGRRVAHECFRAHVRDTARKVPGVGPGLFGIVDAGALIRTEPKPNGTSLMTDEASDLTGSGEVARLLGSEDVPSVKSLLAKALLGEPATPDDDTLVALEPWIDEVVFILYQNSALRLELCKQLAAKTLTPRALRASWLPHASHALQGQLISADAAGLGE